MADDLTIREPQDKTLINMNQTWEVNWWTKKFGCTKAQLQAAVDAVGNSAKKVQEYLGK
ncbi:MAG: DUF3606 domain-containing protein [Labilithrix sp.]|nr:DUF3606 domain-containing protein [Labilithrix sp.]